MPKLGFSCQLSGKVVRLVGPSRRRLFMKQDTHPQEYRPVVFQDASAEYAFLTRSCVETDDSIEWEDGKTYPLYKLDISSASHPFYTGKQRIVDTAGRVERFRRRYGLKQEEQAED
jgi:large subunit ribosomal protein L31